MPPHPRQLALAVSALAAAASARPLCAQAPQETVAAAAPPPAVLALAPGTPVRVTFADPSAVRLRRDMFVRPQTPIAGRLVALDSASVTVDLPRTGQFTFPSAAVRRLDVRRRSGACRHNVVTRAGCLVAGGAVFLSAGAGAAILVGGWDDGPSRGTGAGLLLGAVAVGGLGSRLVGTRWERAAGWPAAPAAAR